MNLAIRYLRSMVTGSLVAMSFVVISYCILFPNSMNFEQLPYYGFYGAIYAFVFLSLLIIIKKTKLFTLYTKVSYQFIGIISAIIACLPAITIILKESPLPLMNELKNILIFVIAHIFLGWFVGFLSGKINENNA